MSLSVLGAGFGRTGTMSLKLALEKLGLGRCYHMAEVFQNPGHAERWSAAAEGEKVDWDALLAGYGAAVDWPSTYFWRELAAYYPNAKIILTLRSAESWYKSCQSTIFQAMTGTTDDPVRVAQQKMARRLVVDGTFGARIDDAAHTMAVYEKHNEEVRRVIPKERLLVYEIREGWAPLCSFLGLPVPEEPFPRVNSTEEFQSRLLARGE